MTATKARILFVDDEPAILDGLRDLLRKDRKQWDMVFAQGGAQALAELERAPTQIVVSDMCMPGMDGAELLTRVKTSYPSVTRILLSGHSERSAIMRALPVVHQFLTKPCDAGVLRSTIERTHGLHTRLDSERVRSIVGNVERLPSVPKTYHELTKVASDPTKGLVDIANVIRLDPAMSVKVLQLVNSAYFCTSRRISSIAEAVSFLGIDLIKGLALTANAFSALDGRVIEGFSIDRLQTFSVLCAKVAKRLCGARASAEEAFTAGLVHDIGKIVLAIGLPEELAASIREAKESKRPLEVVERERIGVTHAEAGAFLMGVWGLPFPIVEAVAFHHEPRNVTDGARQLLAVVHAATVLVEEALEEGDGRVDVEFIADAGLAGEMARWRSIAAGCSVARP